MSGGVRLRRLVVAAVTTAIVCAGFFGPADAGASFENRTVAGNQFVGEPRIFTDPTASGAKFFYLGPGTDDNGNLNTLFWWSGDGAHWSGPALTNQANGGNDSDIAIDSRHTVYVADLSDPAGNFSMPISVWNPSSHKFSRVGMVAPGAPDFDRQWIASPSAGSVAAIALDGDGIEHSWVSTDGAHHFAKGPNVDTGVLVAGPLVTGKASSGHPAPLYFLYNKSVASSGLTSSGCTDELRMAKSTDGGRHWATFRVSKEQDTTLFPVVASDSAGGLYAAWTGCDPTSNNSGVAMFSASTDGGKSWHAQRALSDTTLDALGDAPATIFPWVVAGNAGRVDVTFAIERQPVINSFEGPDDGGPQSQWNLELHQSTNANTAHPVWHGVVLKSDFHTGSICSLGTGCVGPQGLLGAPNVPGPFDRRDLDFFGAALDGSGRLFAPYTADRAITPTDPTTILVASVDLDEIRQVGGTTLGSSGH